MTDTLDYDAVRSQIEDGDLILWSGNYFISRLFKKVFRCEYSHAALVICWQGRLIALQAVGRGVVAVPLSEAVRKYNGKVDWYKLVKVTTQNAQPDDLTETHWAANKDKVLNHAVKDLGLPFNLYRMLKHFLIRLGLRLKQLVKKDHPEAMFCSQYIAHCFAAGDIKFTTLLPHETMPRDLRCSPLTRFAAPLKKNPRKWVPACLRLGAKPLSIPLR